VGINVPTETSLDAACAPGVYHGAWGEAFVMHCERSGGIPFVVSTVDTLFQRCGTCGLIRRIA
jgi:hypothetical protein